MAKKRKKTDILHDRSGLWIIIVAAVILEATACIQYFYSRAGLRDEAEHRAVTELKRAELEIDVICKQIETSVRMMSLLAERNLQYPDSMYSITCLMMKQTPNMVGAALAFEENYYPQYGKWFEAYCGMVTKQEQIGSETHDYFKSEWYNNGLTIDSCWWCEPYFDNAGAKETLVSCSYPIHNGEGRVVGVALADMSLVHLQRISHYLRVYPNSYFSITSGNGTELVPSPDTIAGKKYHIFEEDVDVNGWIIRIIIPDEEIYGNLKRIGLIVTILMIFGLAMLIFIMYASARNVLKLLEINGQKKQIEGELNIARKIQMAMLPKTFPPYHDCTDLNVYGIIVPAKEVGGDLYDFYICHNKLFFCIGDVSGKGIPASLVMAVTRSMFRTLSAQNSDPAKIATLMNNSMSEVNEQNMFVTFFLGILDLDTGRLDYCNAGHNAPILISDQVEMVNVLPNLPLGILSGYTFISQSINIKRGDTLFFYTDGLTEAENINKDLFGEQQMIDNIKQWKNTYNAKDQIEAMQRRVNQFVGNAEQSDDLTMMSIRYLPQARQTISQDMTDQISKYQIVMRNDIQQIPTLAEWVEGLGIPTSLNMTINLALEEAVTNVMLYAYPNSHGSVIIDAEKSKKQIKFVISDTGIPFDPTKKEDVDISLPAEEREIGGLGIHLVRQIMDTVAYERKNDKNILTLTKQLEE